MEAEQGTKVEIQLAARDSNTRKLVSQMGKRHKWLASDISTSRQLLSVAMNILRNLGIDANHQVILYPDISVHTHLKYTPVSWGPTFDPTLPLRDIHKIFGSPVRLHFLYHIIAPEALSPPGKTPRQDLEQDGWGVQQLQPRQLSFAGGPGNQQQSQLQQLQPVSDQQEASMHEVQPAGQQPQQRVSQPCAGQPDAAAAWPMGANWHGHQQQQGRTGRPPQQQQQQQQQQGSASAASAGASEMHMPAQPPLQPVHAAYQRQPRQQHQQVPLGQLQNALQQSWAAHNQQQQIGQPSAGAEGMCRNHGHPMLNQGMVPSQMHPAPAPCMPQPVLSEQLHAQPKQQQMQQQALSGQQQQPWEPQSSCVPAQQQQQQQQQQPVMLPSGPQSSSPEGAPWSSQWLPAQQLNSAQGGQLRLRNANSQLQEQQLPISLLPNVQDYQQLHGWQQQGSGLPLQQHAARLPQEQQRCGVQAPPQAQHAPHVAHSLQVSAAAADGVAGAVPCKSHQSSQYSCGHMQQQQQAQQAAVAPYAAQHHNQQQPQLGWAAQHKVGEAVMSSTSGGSPNEGAAATVPSQHLSPYGTVNNVAHGMHIVPSSVAMLVAAHTQHQQSQQPPQQLMQLAQCPAAQQGQLHSRSPSPEAQAVPATTATAGRQPAAAGAGGGAAVRLAIRSADGGVIEVPLVCSNDDGRLVLLPEPSLEQQVKQQLQMQLQQGMQPSAQLVALLQALQTVAGPSTGDTAAAPGAMAAPNAALAACNQLGPPSQGAAAALTMQRQQQCQQPGQHHQQQEQSRPHSQVAPCIAQPQQRQRHVQQLSGMGAAQLPNQHGGIAVDGYQQPPGVPGQCSLQVQQQEQLQVQAQHLPQQQVPAHAQMQQQAAQQPQHATANSKQHQGVAKPLSQQHVLNTVQYQQGSAHTGHQLVSVQYQQPRQQLHQGLSHVLQTSVGAPAISAAALSGFAAVSSGPSAAASPALQDQAADVSSPAADLRSHCSSVSCGAAASGGQAGAGRLSRMAPALNSAGSADLAAAAAAANGGSLVPEVGGSATRSSQRPSLEGAAADQQTQQVQQQQQQGQAALAAGAAGGRGVLQPRQLQLHARPQQQQQQQQQQGHWQPRLQPILEMEGSRDSVPSATPTASAGVAAGVANASQAEQAMQGVPATQASPTADGGVSGALELQLDDDGAGDGASQQPPCQQHTEQSQPDANACSDDDGEDDAGSDGHDRGYQDDDFNIPNTELQHSSPKQQQQQQQQREHDGSQVQHQMHSSLQLQRPCVGHPRDFHVQRQLGQGNGLHQQSQQHPAQQLLEMQHQSLPQHLPSPARHDSRANAQNWNQHSCAQEQQQQQQQPQQQQSLSGASGGCGAAGVRNSSNSTSQPMSGQLEPQQSQQLQALSASVATNPPAIKLGTSLMLGKDMGMQPPANRSLSNKLKANTAGSKAKRRSIGFVNHSSFYSNYYQYPPGKYPRLAANLTQPADRELRLPSIISSGASCKGTWHSSTNNWDSRGMQTPMKPDEIAVGSIFSVEELRKQSEMQRQQRAAELPVGGGGGGGGGGGSSSSSGSKRAAEDVAAAGSRPSKQSKAGLKQEQRRGQPQQEQQQRARPSMQQVPPHDGMQEQTTPQQQVLQQQLQQQQQQQPQQQQGHLSLQPQQQRQQNILPQQQQADTEADAVSAGGPYSQPGSTSLGGWCTVAPAGRAGANAGGGSGHNSIAADASNRASPESADDAGTAIATEAGVGGQTHSAMPDGAEQHRNSLAQSNQHAEAMDRHPHEAAAAETGAEAGPQQQQQQQQSQQQAQWAGFQAAAPTSTDGASPDAIPAADAPYESPDADAVGHAEQQHDEHAAEPVHEGVEIDMAALDEVLNTQSLLDLEQAHERQQQQQAASAAAVAAAAAAANSGSGGVTMHEALKAAGVIPPSPDQTNAAQQAGAGPMHGQSVQVPPVVAQHAANQAGVGCQQGTHQQGSNEQLPQQQAAVSMPWPAQPALGADGPAPCPVEQQQQQVLTGGAAGVQQGGASDSQGTGEPCDGHLTRQRARTLAAAAAGGALPAPASSGEGWSTGDEGQPAPGATSSTGQSDRPKRRRNRNAGTVKPPPKCRVPLPSVEQLLIQAAPLGPPALASKAPLPPPAGAHQQQQRKGAAAPALQRVTMADGSTIFVAGAKPGAPAAQGRQPQQQLQQPLQQQPLPLLPSLPLLGPTQLPMLGAQPLATLPLHLQQQQLLQALQVQAQQQLQQQQLSAPARNESAATAAAAGMQTPMGGVSASQLAAALHRMAAATGTQPGTAAAAAGTTTATDAPSTSRPPAMPLSGLITPNILSPTKLISPAGQTGAGVAGAINSMTVDCLEALLGDKELNFLSPDKSLYMFNNNSTLGGLLSCLASPANMLFSPVKAPQQDHNAGEQQQQVQQQSGQAAAGVGASAGGNSHDSTRPASATDFRSLFQSFKEGSSADVAAGRTAAAAAAGAASQVVPPVVSADVGSGPGDQLQQEQELCQYLLGSGNDSWLMPPPAGADAGNANAAPGPGASAARHAAAAAPADAISNKGGATGSNCKQSAPADACNERKEHAAAAAAQPQRKPARTGAGQGPRRGPATGRPAKQQGAAGRPTQAVHPARKQQQQAAAYNPDKPFAALFPSAGNQST